MWHESAGVPRDRARVLADADAACVAVHHPTADDRAVPVQVGDRTDRLIDARLVAVIAVGFELDLTAADDLYVPAFATLDRQPIEALVVVTSPFFVTRARQIVALVARHRVPAIYGRREYAEAGGLMSYGYDVGEGYRQLGNYAGRILKGDKPGDLPVVQPTKFEFVINSQTARTLGIEVTPTLRAIADGVIE